MLLLAATFEVFVREMAKLAAKHVVSSVAAIADVPHPLLRTAWNRTFDTITRTRLPQGTRTNELHATVHSARGRADSVFSFLEGKMTEDIYDELVRTGKNMRVGEINRLFSLSRLPKVCAKVAEQQPIIDHFHSGGSSLSATDLERFINEFIDRRNKIAHQLTAISTFGPTVVHQHITVFRLFADSLCAILEGHTAQLPPVPTVVSS